VRNPNAAVGSWTLLNEAGEVLLEGTWSEQKMGKLWQGTRIARRTKGQSFSGTWTADAANLIVESLAEMLKSAATKGSEWLVAKWPPPRKLVAKWFKAARSQIVG